MHEVIIIGSGAAGLMAGTELASKNKSVLILEARDRIGGRMHTIDLSGFLMPVEEGAEFIHGDLPLSLSILAETKTDYSAMRGKIWRYENDRLFSDNSFIEDDNGLIPKLKQIENDMSVKDFLLQNFDEAKDAKLIHSIKKFVEGYDSADYSKASLFSFREEWLSEVDSEQNRIEGGYKTIYEYLEKKIHSYGGKIEKGKCVKKISYRENSATVYCSDGTEYNSSKVIVTVPTGVLRNKDSEAFISFEPEIPELAHWLDNTGYGSIIKFVFQFAHPFWDNKVFEKENVRQAPDMAFLFSDETIPTWWTQLPDENALLTGWLAGPEALKFNNSSPDELMQTALSSLSNIFNITIPRIREILVASHVKNWSVDPFTLGAYAYRMPSTKEAMKKMLEPFGNTVYFAGEAFYDGKEMGTVEAAFNSGLNTAKKI